MDMTKFATVDDPGFVAICGELRRWIKDIDAPGSPPLTSSSKIDGQPDAANQPGTQPGMASQPNSVSQPGDGNRQFNFFGSGNMNNVDGHYFMAQGDQNFGMIPPK